MNICIHQKDRQYATAIHQNLVPKNER